MKRVFVCIAPLLLVLAGLVKAAFFPSLFFGLYGHENRHPGAIGEWLQFLAYFGAFVLAISGFVSAAGIRSFALSRRLLLGFAVVAFLVAMEEISWGQRVFAWSTPESLQALNIQAETNLHNLRYLQGLTHLSYALIGLCGGLGFLLLGNSRLRRLSVIIPPWYISPYFLLPGIYYVLRMLDVVHSWKQELFELVLSLGFILLSMRILFLCRRAAFLEASGGGS